MFPLLGTERSENMPQLIEDSGSFGIGDGGSVNGAGSGGIADAGSSFVGDGSSGVIDPYTT